MGFSCLLEKEALCLSSEVFDEVYIASRLLVKTILTREIIIIMLNANHWTSLVSLKYS